MKSSSARKAEVRRKTKETDIAASICLDGKGASRVDSGIPFLDHMLELFSKHGFFDLALKARGDIKVDYHHTIEDIGIVLGEALKDAVGDKKGINRYGFCVLPMDEALALVSLDLSGRPYLAYDVKTPIDNVNGIDVRLFHEFFYALAMNSGMTLHMRLLAGDEVHHIVEALFKCFAKALRAALDKNPRGGGMLPSTKGKL